MVDAGGMGPQCLVSPAECDASHGLTAAFSEQREALRQCPRPNAYQRNSDGKGDKSNAVHERGALVVHAGEHGE